MQGRELENDLRLYPVLHVVLEYAGGLIMDVGNIALQLQIMLVEVIRYRPGRFGHEVVCDIPVRIEV
jgi:hypothetical protein